MLNYTYSIPWRWHRLRIKKKIDKAALSTHQGLLAVVTGDWHRAQKKLIYESKYAPVPLVNYLAAAFAAAGDGALKQRDDYLCRAEQLIPAAKLPIGLLRAQLQYDASQYDFALATLQQLIKTAPKQKQVLRLLVKVYKKLGAWQDLVILFPVLQQQKIFPAKFLKLLGIKAYSQIFMTTDNVVELMQLWKKVPPKICRQAKVMVFYIEALLRLKQNNTANKVICKALQHSWNTELVLLFAKVKSNNTSKQLLQAEHWLKSHQHDASLLFVLGQLAARNQLWGKAKDYYRASLDSHPNGEVYLAYAKLLEQLGEIEESLQYYRSGLLQVTS